MAVKNPDKPIVGWVLTPHGPAYAPNVIEAFEELTYTDPLLDWDNGRNKDPFALALWIKMMGAAAVNVASVEPIIRIPEHLNEMTRALEILMDHFGARKVLKVDSRTKFERILKSVESGEISEGAIVHYNNAYHNSYYIVTWVRFYPSYSYLGIYGLFPDIGVTEEPLKRLAVAIPLRWSFGRDELPPLEHVPESKLTSPSSPRSIRGIPGVTKYPIWPQFGFFPFKGSASIEVANPFKVEPGRLKKAIVNDTKLEFPMWWRWVDKELLAVASTYTSDCPLALKLKAMEKYIDAVVKKYRGMKREIEVEVERQTKTVEVPMVTDTDLEPFEVAKSVCTLSKPVFAGTNLVVTTHYFLHPLMNLPFINAWRWAVLHNNISSITIIDELGNYVKDLKVDISGDPKDVARSLVIRQSVAWRFAFFFPFRAKTISPYERTSTHYVYGAVSILPMLSQGYWQKGHLFESLFVPVMTTFSRDNVHPAGLLLMYKEGDVLLPLHKAQAEEIEKLANYLYFIDAVKSVGPPDPEEAPGGFNIDVLPRDRVFTNRERKFYKFIVHAGEQIDTNDYLRKLFDYAIRNVRATLTDQQIVSYMTTGGKLIDDGYVATDITELLSKLPERVV